jgi:hypothetical protein
MAGTDTSLLATEHFEDRLAALKQAAKAYGPPRRLLKPLVGDERNAALGQIWRTKAASEAAGLHEDFDPSWVILLGEKTRDAEQTLYEAAPLFTAIEMSGAADIVLPRELLGFACAASLGAVVPILSGNLLTCEGELPSEWVDRVLGFRQHVEDDRIALPEGVYTGLPYIDEADPAINFHRALADRLDYLKEPAFAWLAVHQQKAPAWVDEMAARLGAAWRSAADWWAEHAIEWAGTPGAIAFQASSSEPGRELKNGLWVAEAIGVRILISETELGGDKVALNALVDPNGLLEGASVLDSARTVIATITKGGASFSRPAGGVFLLRTSDGEFVALRREHD